VTSKPTRRRARTAARPYADTWVVLPTYDEADNLPAIAPAILEQLPGATLLVVDDASPDGTGRLADELAGQRPDVRVLHRPGKHGLGRAYVDGFRHALAGGAGRIVQMDADWSHDPARLPALLEALGDDPGRPREGSADGSAEGAGGGSRVPGADLAIGSRYVAGGGTRNWGLMRRFVSRGGSIFAGIVLGLPVRDLTGGFKAWRRDTLAGLPWSELHSGGYVFQIETTYLARRRGARIAEVPIVFEDRRVGVSKMSRRIIVEALFVVLRLRWQQLRGRHPRPD
jgi:dolichol-phosphate mannosyltransferase